MPRKKSAEPKKGFLDGYKTYDPSQDGYGNVNQWHSLFDATMNGEQAATILNNQKHTPLEILGFLVMPTLAELKTRYRKLVMELKTSFGLNPTPEQTREATEVIAAYTLLKDKLDH